MNAKKVKDALLRAGYKCDIVSIFAYDVDRNRRFFVVRVDSGSVDCRLISLLDSMQCIAVLSNAACITNDLNLLYICVDVYPKDMASFDWDD